MICQALHSVIANAENAMLMVGYNDQRLQTALQPDQGAQHAEKGDSP